jgi:hypothetical protein
MFLFISIFHYSITFESPTHRLFTAAKKSSTCIINTMSNISPQVIKMSTSFNVNDMPDAKALADQYGLDYEDEDELNTSNTSRKSYDMNNLVAEMKDSQQENVRIDKLVTKLDSKNKEIERLCVLLETIEMVPGADPNKYLDVINGNDEEVVSLLIALACNILYRQPTSLC